MKIKVQDHSVPMQANVQPYVSGGVLKYMLYWRPM